MQINSNPCINYYLIRVPIILFIILIPLHTLAGGGQAPAGGGQGAPSIAQGGAAGGSPGAAGGTVSNAWTAVKK